MPVPVPRLNRLRAQQSPRGQRINVRARSNADLIQSRSSNLAKLGDKAIDFKNAYEDQKIDQIATQVEQDYTPWLSGKLAEAKNYEGDPTNVYAQLDKEEDEKIKSYLDAQSDLSDGMKQRLSAKINGMRSKNRLGVLKQRGYQQEIYKNNLFESSLKLKKQSLGVTAGNIQKGNPSSFLPYDMNVADIKTEIAKRGLDTGTVERLADDATDWHHIYQDNNGNPVKVKYTKIGQERVARELSEGITDSVKVLLDSGYREEAQELKERYKGYIDPINDGKLQKKFKDVDLKSESSKFISGISNLSDEDQIKEIEKINDPLLKEEVLKLQSSLKTKLKTLRKDKEDKNYEVAYTQVAKLQEAGAINGVADIERDSVVSQVWDNMSEKQRQSLKEFALSPRKTDTSALVKVNEFLLSDRVESMPVHKFEEMLVGLNKTDKTKARDRFFRRKNKQQTGNASANYNYAAKLLESRMIADKIVAKDKFGRNIKPDDLKKYQQSQDELIDFLDSKDVSKETSRKEISDYIHEYITEQKKTKLFGGGGFFDSDDLPESWKDKKSVNEFKQDPLEGLSRSQIIQLQREYKLEMRASKVPSPNDVDFLNYVNKKKSGQ